MATKGIRYAVGAIILCDNLIALVHKVKNSNKKLALQENGVWDFLKGGVEENETLIDALHRELLEELSINQFNMICPISKPLCFDFPDVDGYPYQSQETYFYIVQVENKESIQPDNSELDSVRFVALDDVISALTFDETKKYFNSVITDYLYCFRKQFAKVSVIMPVYNRESTIERAINSVLIQKYNNIELIVVDDGSTDSSVSIITKIQEKDARVKLLKNTKSKGVSGARNTGLSVAQGGYVAFLDSDDIWDDDYLCTSINALEKTDSEVVFSLWIEQHMDGSSFKMYSADFARKKFNKGLDILKSSKMGSYYIFEGNRLYEYVLCENFYIFHINTTVLRWHSGQDGYLTFDENLKAGEDTDYICRLIRETKCCFMEEYHYYHFQGIDNLYNFIERDNASLEKIIASKEIAEKFTQSDIHKIEMLKRRIKYVQEDSKFSEKELCIRRCNDKIAKKYLTLSLMNQKINRKKAIYLGICSLFWKSDVRRWRYVRKLLCFWKKDIILADDNELYFY